MTHRRPSRLNSSSTHLKHKRQRGLARNHRLYIERLEDRRMLAGDGLQAQYFNTDDLSGPALVRVDSTIDFNWAAGSPDASIGADTFSARWNGQLESRFTETHTFYVNANDGARLWVNGVLLIDQFDSASVSNASASIDLIAGRRYDIQFEYRENTGSASARLEWDSDSLNREVIPTSQLFSGNRGSITAQRFNNIAGSSVSDLTSDADFPDNPNTVTALSSFESNSNIGSSLGQRISGYLHAPETGPYQFFLSANDSAELWLSNSADPSDRQLIASVNSATAPQEWDAQASQSSSVVLLAAGQKYYIEALHKESTGADHLAVGWVPPGETTIEVIDGQYLSPVEPVVRIFSETPNVAEGSVAPARFTVTRDGGPNTNALAVDYSVRGDATNGVDYQSLSGTITIPAGADSVDLVVTPIADNAAEGDESFVIELLAGDGYEVGLQSERTVNGTLQDNAAAPAGGTVLYENQSLSDFIAFGGSYSTINDPTFGSVIQGIIPTQASSFNAQLIQATSAPISEGDLLLFEVNVRSVGGDGQISAVFENRTTFEKSLFQGVSVTTDWATIQIPFASIESYAAGDASFGLFLGAQAQTIQVADFRITNYGPSQTLAPETDFRLNNIGGTFGVSQPVQVTGQSFDFAYEVQTTSIPPASYRIQAQETNSATVNSGDTMRFEFAVRAVAGAAPRTAFLIQDTAAFGILLAETIIPTDQWETYSFDLTVDEDFSVDGLQAVFNLGFGLQTVQIGGFRWTNIDNAVDLESLPQQFPSATYGGRTGTDDWRADAEARIQADRRSDVTIIVNDANGLALDGAVVSVRQTDHDFTFGSAISAFDSQLDPNGNATALRYQSEINRLFNTVVVENSLKWDQFINNRQRGIDAADFATDNDLFLRGHNIIWPSRFNMPESVWNEYDARVIDDGLTSANDWLRTTIEARFDDVLNTFDGQITEWDVVNELFTNHDVLDVLGDDIVLDWFQRVRDFDANIDLTYNDFNIFTGNGGDVNHRENFDFWLGELRDADLLDVIGIQGHFTDANLSDISVLEDLIISYSSDFGAPIAITEFDLSSNDEQVQADFLRDFMTIAFSQPGVSQFLHWGFWEGAHFQPESALYNLDFSIKPNGQAYEDLVFGNWWTDVAGTTEAGQFETRAFLGEYDIEVQYEGQVYTSTVSVDDSGNSSVTLNLPVASAQYGPVVTQGAASVSGDVLSTITNSGTWAATQGEAVSLSASIGQVTQNADGTWSWALTPTEQLTDAPVTITGTDSGGQTQQITFNVNAITVLTAPIVASFERVGGGNFDGTETARPDLAGPVSFTFDADVIVNVNDLEITNQTLGGSTVDTAGVGFSYDSTTFTATWNLSTLTTPLEAGFYDIELKSDSIEAVDSGLLLDGDEDGQGGDQFSKSYYLAIPGDANLDGQVTLSVPNLFTRVNTGDVAIARSNVGAANVSWQQGDFDGNGEVSLSIPNLFTRVNTGDVAVARANVGRDVRPPTTAASAKLPAVLPEITTATVTAQASVLPVTVVSVVDPVGAPLATVQPVAPIEVARVQSIEPAAIHSTESIVDSEPAQPPVLSQSFAALPDDSDTPEVIVTGETPTIPSTSTLAALSGSLAADHAQSDNSDRDDVFSNLTDEDVRDTDLADIIFPIAAVVE